MKLIKSIILLGHTPKDLARYNHLTEAYTLLEQEERKTNRYVAVVPGNILFLFCYCNLMSTFL